MPKLNVYVPDSLALRIRETGVAVSATCQRALEAEVRRVEATRAAEERARQMAARLREYREQVRPDDLAREIDGHAAGVQWAVQDATIHELSQVVSGEGADILVNRQSGSLDQVLADAGLVADSETNRILSPDDPWCRGFVRGCREMWHEVQPLLETDPSGAHVW